ncbi:MAG: efflux transporter outer membrane subunit [Betaproteobacteria bacterium]
MARRHALVLCVVGLAAAGCTTGPDYKRPELQVPPAYRGAGDVVRTAGADAQTFGTLAWTSVFTDPELQGLIRTALAQNYDLRVAVSRILQAQSQVTIAGAQPYPTVDAAVTAPYTGYSGSDRPATLPDNSIQPQAGFGVAWELDFWGKFRRNSEAAWADLLATEEARYAVMATLVSQVGQAYLNLRALDLSLEISRRTENSRRQSLELVQARLDGGVASIMEVRQAETLLYSATKTIPELQRQIEQNENLINVLLGQNPGPVQRGRPLEQQIVAPTLPPGLPSDLLERRPDIRQAEQQLVSANAQIGVAKALLYPRITLNGFAGGGGATIDGTTFGPYGILGIVPSITLPVFDMGRLQANVEFNEALAQEAGLRYRQTLQQAFREVADALVEVRKRQEFRQQQELLVNALADASQVANIRYEGGVSSYLEVLDTERQYFDAEVQLVLAKRDEYASVIQLYKALGGGWQPDPPAVAAAGGEATSTPTASASTGSRPSR